MTREQAQNLCIRAGHKQRKDSSQKTQKWDRGISSFHQERCLHSSNKCWLTSAGAINN